jgi:hypothetical protein
MKRMDILRTSGTAMIPQKQNLLHMKKLFLLALGIFISIGGLFAQEEVSKPIVVKPVFFDVSPPLRDMINMDPGEADMTWKDGVVKNNMDTDTLIRLNFIRRKNNISDTLNFDYAFFGNEFHRTLSARFEIGNLGITDLDVSWDETFIRIFPNPTSGETMIRYLLSDAGYVELKVFDLMGREISLLVNSWQAPGEYTVLFDASVLSSGIFNCVLKTGNEVTTAKMMKL